MLPVVAVVSDLDPVDLLGHGLPIWDPEHLFGMGVFFWLDPAVALFRTAVGVGIPAVQTRVTGVRDVILHPHADPICCGHDPVATQGRRSHVVTVDEFAQGISLGSEVLLIVYIAIFVCVVKIKWVVNVVYFEYYE